MFSKRKEQSIVQKKKLVSLFYPDSLIAEQFRTVQTNLKFAAAEKNSRTFLITSPTKGEGKSTIAANLAISLALQKDKVLLIDGNFRNPKIHTMFNVSNKIGLSNILSGLADLEEAIHRTEIGRLHVLPCGPLPVNPIEMLSSNHMEDFLKKLNLPYDFIIIDSPAIHEVTDTKILANQCDGVILVVHIGKTLLDKAEEAIKLMKFGKCEITGIIVNE